MTPLFVYGTLRKGRSNFRNIERLVTGVSPGWFVTGTLYDLGPYPALILCGEHKIRGQLLTARFMHELLAITDRIEGDEYGRVLVPVYRDSNPALRKQAWLYSYLGDTSKLPRLGG